MKTLFLILFLSINCCFGQKAQIHQTINQWHLAAAMADFKGYFDLMAPNAIFIGTDPTENWTKSQFEAYAKPHFNKGKAWKFEAIERNIFMDQTKSIVWFDELLKTEKMGICRGSGVLVKINGQWKIKHYVLSISIPNDIAKETIQLKTINEDSLMKNYKILASPK